MTPIAEPQLAGASAGAGERGAKSYLGRASSLEGRLYAIMNEDKEDDGKLLFPCSAQQETDGRGFEIGRDEAGFSSSEGAVGDEMGWEWMG